MLLTLAVSNYCSLHALVMPLAALNLVDRRGAVVRIRDGRTWRTLDTHVDAFDSILRQIADPEGAPEVLLVRQRSYALAGVGGVARLAPHRGAEATPGCNTLMLEKPMSETVIAGQGTLDEPAWHWPAR